MSTDIWDFFDNSEKTPYKESPDHDMSIYKCSDCESYDLIYADGQYSCSECGLMQEKILSQEAEYRFYGNSDSRSVNPERVGMATNVLLPQSSMGSTIQKRRSDNLSIKRMVQYNSWNQMPYKERSLYKICSRIARISKQAGIPRIIIERAKELYSIVKKVNISRGDNRDGLIAACVWVACKDLEVPRSSKEIACIFEIKLQDMTRGIKFFRENWRLANEHNEEISMESSNPINFIERYCSPLRVNDEIKHIAEFISVKAMLQNLVDDNTAPSIAAGSIYLACCICNKNIRKDVVAKACKISTVTISKCYKKLECHKLSLLPKSIIKKYSIN